MLHRLSGNRLLNDSECFGQSALARFNRDLLGQDGVRYVIDAIGFNDIFFPTTTFPPPASNCRGAAPWLAGVPAGTTACLAAVAKGTDK
jgi:hypothetical protein